MRPRPATDAGVCIGIADPWSALLQHHMRQNTLIWCPASLIGRKVRVQRHEAELKEAFGPASQYIPGPDNLQFRFSRRRTRTFRPIKRLGTK